MLFNHFIVEFVNLCDVNIMNICDYGCGQEAIHQFKNGKWCCSIKFYLCEGYKNSIKGENNYFYGKKHSDKTKRKIGSYHKNKIISDETKRKMSESRKGLIPWNKDKKLSDETKRKMSESRKGLTHTKETKEKIGIAHKGMIHSNKAKKLISKANKKGISKYKTQYPIFSKVEEMRYNPDKPGKKEIQVHCKNHLCPNSKKQDGWFTPTYQQIYERMRQLEHPEGTDGSYFYCCDECKFKCPLYKMQPSVIINQNNLPSVIQYTQEEHQTFRNEVLKRANYKCEYCGNKAIHVHHSRPQKLEPFYSLDPDFGIACCEKCHYEKGHKDECSTGNLANKVCS